MRPAWTAAQIRSAERSLLSGLPAGTLMQRAAAGLAVAAREELRGVYGRRVGLLVGAGDNGNDTLWAGQRLAQRGAAVRAVLLRGEGNDPAAVAALLRAGGRLSPAQRGPDELRGADLVCDGLVGIGGRGPLRADAAALLDGLDAPVLAVDVPSGVDPDTGATPGAAVTAIRTVTFGGRKPGLLLAPQVGRLDLVDIGLGGHLPPARVAALDLADVGALLPVPGPADSKYTRGVLGVVAGSERYPGAGVLCCGGALRGSCGYLRFVSGPQAVAAVRGAWPEAVTTELRPGVGLSDAGRVQAWVIGPGLGTGPDARALLHQVLASDAAAVLDADALTLLAQEPGLVRDRRAPTLLTPHAGEFARLAPGVEVERDRIGAARDLAVDWGVTVLLKGHATVVAAPDSTVRIADAATGWLATAGSGDVLAGLAGSLLAAGLSGVDAGSCAAYLHGRAAQSCGGPLVPTDLLRELPACYAAALRCAPGRRVRR